jgi:hypothetical protein
MGRRYCAKSKRTTGYRGFAAGTASPASAGAAYNGNSGWEDFFKGGFSRLSRQTILCLGWFFGKFRLHNLRA